MVRTATRDDAESIAAIYAPYVTGTAISFEEVAPSADEMRDRLSAVLQTHPYLVFEDGGAVVGYAYASPRSERASYRWSVDVAVYVAPGQHRRGVGLALYSALLPILERQGFHSAFAGIALPNEGSVGLHEAVGFRHLGTFAEVGFKFGKWRDVGWWRRGIGQGPPNGEPIPFPELL